MQVLETLLIVLSVWTSDLGVWYPSAMSFSNVRPHASADPLGEALHLLRLTGTLYCRAELTAPWGVEIPHIENHMMFSVVTSGQCWIEMAGEEPRLLQQGSLTLIPHGNAHILRSELPADAEPLGVIPIDQISDRYEIMQYGGGGALTQATYGVVRFDHVAAQRLVALLPNILCLNSWNAESGSWLQSTLGLIALESSALQAGGETVLTRLADILIIQAIRAWLISAPEAQTGWLAALRDKQIGRALSLMHKSPDQEWSVNRLAREVGMSRSNFSARFTHLVGDSVSRYLTKWRMQLACKNLEETSESISKIALESGYQSEAAFCRAFRRLYNVPPSHFRKNMQQFPAKQ